MLAIPSIYVFITKYCLNLKIQGFFHNPFKNKGFFFQIAITSVLIHIWSLVNILMISNNNTTITTTEFCVQ